MAKASIDESLERLGVDYLDLLLIHWPNPKALRENDAWKAGNAGAWKAMEEAYKEIEKSLPEEYQGKVDNPDQ